MRHAHDRGVESAPPVDGLDYRLIGGDERGLQPEQLEQLGTQPGVVRNSPRLPPEYWIRRRSSLLTR